MPQRRRCRAVAALVFGLAWPPAVLGLAVPPTIKPMHRRELLVAHSAACAVSLFGLSALPAAAKDTIELAGVSYTPAAMVLQMAEQTAVMEGIMRQSAKDMDTMTVQQRDEAGATNAGPGVVGRQDMAQSVDVMIKNSRLETLPNGLEAASKLRGIRLTAKMGQGPLEKEDYLIMAQQYAATREDLRRGFEAMTPEEQAEGKRIVRELRQRDEAKMKEFQEEAERVEKFRARIAADNAAAPTSEPPRRKTLKELEEAQQAAFGKEPKAPTISLYGR